MELLDRREEMLGSRDEELPSKFTQEEQEAYRWLWDVGEGPWLVDLVSKEVTTPDRKYSSLLEYRKVVEERAMGKAKKTVDHQVLRPGVTQRFLCDECSTEFEIPLEPNAEVGMQDMMDPKRVEVCPFCESTRIGVC